MSVPILFFLTLVAVVFLTLLLVEKNNTIESLERETEELKKSLYDLELQKFKFQKEIKKDKDKLQENLCIVKNELEEERKEYFRKLEALNVKVAQLNEYKTESQKKRKNLMDRLNYAKNKLEEEREQKQEAIKTKEQLNEIVSKLEVEKNLKQKDFETTINNKSLTINKLNERLLKLENELNKAKEDNRFYFTQIEDSKKHADSLEKKNKELENLVCELRKQLEQTESGLKNTRTQKKNKSDNPFERMSIW